MIWMQIVATTVFCGAIIFETLKNYKKKPALCDSCKYLTRKGGGSLWKYHCGNGYGENFDKPPEYCVNYKRREES